MSFEILVYFLALTFSLLWWQQQLRSQKEDSPSIESRVCRAYIRINKKIKMQTKKSKSGERILRYNHKIIDEIEEYFKSIGWSGNIKRYDCHLRMVFCGKEGGERCVEEEIPRDKFVEVEVDYCLGA